MNFSLTEVDFVPSQNLREANCGRNRRLSVLFAFASNDVGSRELF